MNDPDAATQDRAQPSATSEESAHQAHLPGGTSPRLAVVIAGLATGIFLVDFLTPNGVAIGVLYAALVLVSLWSPDRRFTLMVTGTGMILTVLGFFCSPPAETFWVAITNRALALLAIGVTAALSLLRKRDFEEQATLLRQLRDVLAQARTLRGLVPVCASCKRIRDAAGAWHDMETYVQAHSEARFSHGICPGCQDDLYGRLYQQPPSPQPQTWQA